MDASASLRVESRAVVTSAAGRIEERATEEHGGVDAELVRDSEREFERLRSFLQTEVGLGV